MKVVHLSYHYGLNNTGGAAIAATRLHLALLKAGVESYVITLSKCEDGVNVIELQLRNSLRRRLLKLLYNIFRNGYLIVTSRSLQIKKYALPAHLTRMVDLEGALARIKPDVVHIHWINGEGFAWRQIANLKYPVVFHLHDMHLFTSAFGCAWNDTRHLTGYTRNNSTYEERFLIALKRKMLLRLLPTVIGPSYWISSEFSRSVVGRGLKTVVIPNILESQMTVRRSLRSGDRRFVLLFGCAAGTQNPYKGWEDLVMALGFIQNEIRPHLLICVFGESAESRYVSGVKVEFLGNLDSVEDVCNAYNSSDIVVLPSRQDNAPSVKFEAWMCGLPVVTFNRQGCAEGVEPKVNGWVSQDGDVADYAKGIEYFYGLWRSGELEKLHKLIAENAAEKYATDKILDQFLKVYNEQIGRCRGL